MNQEVKLPFRGVARRLSGLEQAEATYRNSQEYEAYITDFILIGFNQLIDRFNSLEENSPELSLMPRTQKLLETIGSGKMPRVESFGAREILEGIEEARDPMLAGQDIKNGVLEKSEKNVKDAIGTPSMDTSHTALAVGTAAHILERMIFQRLRSSGIYGIDGQEWLKDDVLFALEDCALLMEAEFEFGISPEMPILFNLITVPNVFGGLGWKKEEQINEFFRAYGRAFDSGLVR